MILKKILAIILLFLNLIACANNKVYDKKEKEKDYYSSAGFALIYEDDLFEKGAIDKKLNTNKITDNKINNEQIIVMHSSLKKNTLVTIINPENSKTVSNDVLYMAECYLK